MPPPTAFFARLAGVTLLYVATAKAGLLLAVVGHTVTLVWAPSGIALAALLAYGYRMAFGVAIGAFIANAWSELPLAAAAGIAAGNTLEALAGAFLLLRLAGFRNALDRRRDVFALILLAAVCATMLSAFVGVATLSLGKVIAAGDYATVWLKWWLGDMMGVLVAAPPLLVWLSRTRPRLSPAKAFEACCLAVALTAVSLNIFGAPELAVQGFYPASLAVFPFIIWGALRFDQWGASLVTLIVSLLAVWCTTHGTGPFVVAEPVDSLVRWCAFAIVLAVTGLLLAASVAEQRRAQVELKSSHDQLEQRVLARTRDLAQTNIDLRKEMTERRRLEASLIRISEEQQQNMGRELHDGLGQQLTGLALFSATLRHRLEEQALPEAELAGRIVEQVHQATAVVRSVAHGLYPSELEFDGLPAALARLAEDTLSLQGLRCTFQSDAGVQVDDALVAINLYRIAQEAVHNAVKYSRASELRIALTQSQGRHQLVVSDNGIGMNLATSQRGRGIGMHSMRYRASLLGGHFDIAPNAPSGTTIRVTYPDQKVQSEQQHGA
ncbi:signal transduction histidine kinase [Rhodoferax ferrireducens]|uniref:Signal transduction histidine kinase n=1 Tax=Rhodoferax ferrireducens TaxID=192843 RepID=A0ABU2C5L0_9BURK|nr:MASE1 domain-containing protein [Rhodoferax ferrireducens]MDR7376605.1 signal transduction histidine kinase [Rhodoferax ferrireducens]